MCAEHSGPLDLGPHFVSKLECLACGSVWVEVYGWPVLLFDCPTCHANEGVRVDEED